MKAKKALKRLSRVETLLSAVMDEYAAKEQDVRELLDSAKASVIRAKESVNLQTSSASKKATSKGERAQAVEAERRGSKKLSIAAKKRWAIAKRRGISAVTGRPLSKTA